MNLIPLVFTVTTAAIKYIKNTFFRDDLMVWYEYYEKLPTSVYTDMSVGCFS